MKKTTTLFLSAVVLGAATVPAARAYVDPSFYIVRELAKRHAAIDEVRIRSRLTFYKKSGEVWRTYTEILGLDDFSKASVKILDAEGVELASGTRSQLALQKNRPIDYDLLFAKDSDRLFERLKELGLPLKTETELYSEKEGILPYKPESWVNLMRSPEAAQSAASSNDNVVLAIGDSSAGTPQLWVTKPNRALTPNSVSSANVPDGYLPVRAAFTTSFDGSGGGNPLEFRFQNRKEYRGQGSHTFFYPARTSVFYNGYLWATVDTLDVRAGDGASHLDQAHVRSEPDGDTKDLLSQYLKWVR